MRKVGKKSRSKSLELTKENDKKRKEYNRQSLNVKQRSKKTLYKKMLVSSNMLQTPDMTRHFPEEDTKSGVGRREDERVSDA